MTLASNRVLLFEDKGPNQEEVWSALNETLGDQYDVQSFDTDTDYGTSDILPELKEDVKDEDGNYPLLIVLDYDLTSSDGQVRREQVDRLCRDEYVPLCLYHRRRVGVDEDRKRLEEFEEDVIKVDPTFGLDEIGRKCAFTAKGFRKILDTFLAMDGNSSPGGIIPELLGAPESVRSKLDQYSWGNPEAIVGGARDISHEEFIQRATTQSGYWVRNELLEFPGALLNQVALAAYLDVDHEAFQRDEEFQAPFDDALYEGPFSDLGKWWWKPSIDKIRANQMTAEDSKPPLGPELFERLETSTIGPAICSDEENGGHEGARYYCIINEAPVCKEHSSKPGGWIPMGATRSRVSESEADWLSPWKLV